MRRPMRVLPLRQCVAAALAGACGCSDCDWLGSLRGGSGLAGGPQGVAVMAACLNCRRQCPLHAHVIRFPLYHQSWRMYLDEKNFLIDDPLCIINHG